jgi:hypothetical protein
VWRCLSLSSCQSLAGATPAPDLSEAESTPWPDLSEALTRHSWKWHIGSGAQQFNADGTYANYNLNSTAEFNPL